jgi:hypothetical protein
MTTERDGYLSDHDDTGGFWGVLAGSGVFLTQAFVLLPGLLPTLLLAGVLAAPLLVLAIPLLLGWGLLTLARTVARVIARAVPRSDRAMARTDSAACAPDAAHV